MNDTESYIRITTSSDDAWRLLRDLVENEQLRSDLTNRDKVVEALRAYDIELSPDAVPENPQVPSEEEAREGLEELIRDKETGAVEPHVGFRPPWCKGTPPPHSATFGYVFGVIGHRAELPPPY